MQYSCAGSLRPYTRPALYIYNCTSILPESHHFAYFVVFSGVTANVGRTNLES